MTETIRVDDLTFLVKRSAQRRTIGLTVERDASLVVHLPTHTDVGKAHELITTKLLWIYQKLAEHKGVGRETVFRQPEFVDGEGFYFLGKHFRLKLIEEGAEDDPIPTIRFEGDRLLFRRDQTKSGIKRIQEYYTRAAHPYLNDLVHRWKAIVCVNPNKYVQVMDLGFRWGSCSSNGNLNFHWRVMQLPPNIIEYIVVHELVHLKYTDHSEAFWSEVRRIMPSFAERKLWLSARGGDL
jgi:predicted metal-dependent hydrolase